MKCVLERDIKSVLREEDSGQLGKSHSPWLSHSFTFKPLCLFVFFRNYFFFINPISILFEFVEEHLKTTKWLSSSELTTHSISWAVGTADQSSEADGVLQPSIADCWIGRRAPVHSDQPMTSCWAAVNWFRLSLQCPRCYRWDTR